MRYLLLPLFILIFGAANAQTENNPDARLFVRYSADYLTEIQQSNPGLISLMNYRLDFSWQIVEIGPKVSEYPELHRFDANTKSVGSAFTSSDMAGFNIMEWNTESFYDKRNYYRLGDTGKVLVIFSEKEVADSFNKTR
jgi:hypothetical protein